MPHQWTAHFIAGRWEHEQGGRPIQVENPATGRVIGSVPEGDARHVDRAVEAARDALAGWSKWTVEDRARLLDRLAALLEERQEQMAQTVTAELGAPIKLARGLHAALPVNDVRETARALRAMEFETGVANSRVHSVPVGVVGAITPWNYPVHQVVSKIVPAIAAGCTVVLKPSELAPLSALLLARTMQEAGLPDGVLNVVNGNGPAVGQAIVDHVGVDAVSFTGSEATGRAVAQQAARTLKRITLELGGKSANVILDDADLVKAVKVGVANCFLNSGQSCNALTRLLVPFEMLAETEEIAAAAAARYVPGDPTDERTRIGPLVSARQRAQVVAAIERGVSDGAKLIAGGPQRPSGQTLETGHYVWPTVFTQVDPGSFLAQEEIFGPVLSIIGYADEADAIAIANNSRFGLGGAVWSADVDRARTAARQIHTGQVDINGGAFNPAAPFGGVKNSGYGRELGRAGIEEFLYQQSLQF
ncbi:aldehyde dehydrogenase family protein [Streptomyces antimycoticus]|uniref:aldehyde dehydrogenase (NAD(+)) n=1 Tax=Streptomyces antimycoticus TaxID=68175 RepID=A0A4D4KPP4_9ACTN|nr:aldehyde dehydrogenase family protein [Streptomyces antimycoticus]GDY48540.1 aldehyde dehydrogenase [Streptomyces antimycoticus]